MNQTICFNCKEKLEPDDQKIKVRQRGKVREWCDACITGRAIELEEAEIKNYEIKKSQSQRKLLQAQDQKTL